MDRVKEYNGQPLQPIHYACREERMYVVFKELMHMKVSTDCVKGNLLHYAVEGGDYEIVMFFLN